MSSILKSTRLHYSLIRFTRYTGGLVGKKKKFILTEPQRIFNFNQLRVRNVAALSAEKEKYIQLDIAEDLDRQMHHLRSDITRKRVIKEDVQKFLENLKQSENMNQSQLMLLLECCTEVSFMCSEKERLQMAENIWNCALNFGMKLNLNNFNALLTVFVKNDHQFSYENFLNDMEKAGVQPNVNTYSLLLRYFCQQGDIVNARNILNKMKILDFSVNEEDFKSLILGYCKIGDFEKAHEIFKIMDERVIKPSFQSYVFLLCGYIEHGKLDKFKEIFNELYNEKNMFISDRGLLEIIYTLAVNKHESYIDEVMERLEKGVNYERFVTDYIQKFLHKKLDSLALKVLRTIDVSDRTFNYIISVSRFMLDHFISYRKPSEILDMCETLEKNGYARAAVGYSLKNITLSKNENYALKFITSMKNRGLPVREHYYWPIIIRATKKGNEHLLKFLRNIPNSVLKNPSVLSNIILPNYEIRDGVKEEFEKLTEINIPIQYIAENYFWIFLNEGQINKVEEIVADYPVEVPNISHASNVVFTHLASNKDKVEQAVNILYNLYCNMYFSRNEAQIQSFFDKVVSSLLKKLKNDEETILLVLKAMLEKKMGISSAMGSVIKNSIPKQDVDDLVSKLTDPNLIIELDENLLSSELKSKKIKSAKSLKHSVFSMLDQARNFRFKEALKIGENFVNQNTEVSQEEAEIVKPAYKNMFHMFIKGGSKAQIKKMLDLDERLGILKHQNTRDDGLILLALLKCNQIPEAIEKFREIFSYSKRPVACTELFIKCFTEGRAEEVSKIINIFAEVGKGNIGFTLLVFSLGILGEVDKAKKILESEGVVFNAHFFQNKLVSYHNKLNSETLENFIEILKDVNNFHSGLTELYKMLVEDYAKNGEVDKILKLYSEINPANIVDTNFLTQLSEFQKNQDVTLLKNSIAVDYSNIRSKETVKANFLDLYLESCDIVKKYESAMEIDLPRDEVIVLASRFAAEGKTDMTCSLVEKYTIEKDLLRVAKAFLDFGKVDEYFKFLDFLESKGNFRGLFDSLKVRQLFQIINKNDAYFEIYKSLSLRCTDETKFLSPAFSCLVTCAKLPGKLADAEEIAEKYHNYFLNLSFSEIRKFVEMNEPSSIFYENVLLSKTLKNRFADNLHEFYNIVINLNCERNNLDKALNYLNQAIDDKVEEALDQSVIADLKTKLKRQGKTCPEVEKIHKVE